MRKLLYAAATVMAVALLTIGMSSCANVDQDVREIGVFSFDVTDCSMGDQLATQIKQRFADLEKELNSAPLSVNAASAGMSLMAGQLEEGLKGIGAQPIQFKFHFILTNSSTGKEVKRLTWLYSLGEVTRLQ
ncbi:MAG: hypothetical protein HUK04_05425 [Bacteroidaceae bacterium]|nr:hypothetical protein [Bacteroidaceae bacterium]